MGLINLCDDIMQLIEGEEQFRGWKTDGRVPGNLKTIFGCLESFLLESQRDIVYRVIFRHHKIQEVHLKTTWHFRLSEQLQITVEMEDVHRELIVAPPEVQLAHFLQEFNRRTDGIYFLKSQTPQLLGFRHKLPYRSQYNYLSLHINNIHKTLSEQFMFFAIKLKIIPNINENQPNRLEKINIALKNIREAIEFNRQKRLLHTSLYNLTGSTLRSITEAINVISTSIGRLKQYKKDVIISEKGVMKAYNHLQGKIRQYLTDESAKAKRQIVWGIQIRRKISERLLAEGGYSIIYSGKYTADAVPTFQSAVALSQQLKAYASRGFWDLVKKIKKPKKQNQKDDFSFQNEECFLKYMRSQKNNRIAQYFLRVIRGAQIQNKQIYLQIYPKNLHQLYETDTVSTGRLINISIQILQGIAFLWSNNILHRDLKEHNIMMNNNGEPKIIDFGSSCGFFTNDLAQYQPFNNDLMSTKGYYVSYGEIKLPKILENYNRDQYNRCSSFDVFSFGQILINVFKLHIHQRSYTYQELVYLAFKCRQLNPADRPTPIQLLVFMKELRNLYIEETSASRDEKKQPKSQKQA